MLAATPAAAAILVVLQMSTSTGSPAGRVITAPHGGYDQNTETIARNMAGRLRWGWVRAIAYRSVPLRYWYDVNRPTERPYSGGHFQNARVTADGRRIYEEYQRKVKSAARRSGAVDLLVEVHGHSRTVNAGGRTLRVQAIELATSGFTLTQLRAIKRHYQQLQQALPQSQRTVLAIDRLDREYEYNGWIIPYYFRASDTKRLGSMRSSQARRALHFELPSRVRNTASTRRAYERLLATLVERAASN